MDGFPGEADTMTLDKITCMLIKETLESMGRGKDQEHVVDILQSHLVTSNDDILALTKDYCSEIGLPWGLILALKSKIRSYRVQLDDPWSMQTPSGKNGEVEISFAAPHIAKNEEKIKAVARRQSSKEMPAQSSRDSPESERGSQAGYPSSESPLSPRSTAPTLAGDSRGAGSSPEEVQRLSALMEEHQKNVNGQ